MVAAADGWVEPPHRDTVAWWSGGGWPADPADNTVYLYGHVSRIEAVFNRLAEAQVGDAVSVTTAAGTLTYRVTEVLPPVAKKDLPSVPEVAAAVPGRLVMIGCHRDPDQGTRPTTSNTVVIAEQQPRSTPSS
jgi:LPXTG-site transpeptidase (sortase) family protein